MSNASDLIEQAEALAGCRWDDPKNPNARAALFASVAREMGQHHHRPSDDVVTGTLLLHHSTPAGKAERAADERMATLLTSGLSPDTLGDLLGRKH